MKLSSKELWLIEQALSLFRTFSQVSTEKERKIMYNLIRRIRRLKGLKK